MGTNALLLFFFLAPGSAADSARSSTKLRIVRAFQSVQSSIFPTQESRCKRSLAKAGSLHALDSAGSNKLQGESPDQDAENQALQQRWQECLGSPVSLSAGYAMLDGPMSPLRKASAARSLAGKASPANSHTSAVLSSPRKGADLQSPFKDTDAHAPLEAASHGADQLADFHNHENTLHSLKVSFACSATC